MMNWPWRSPRGAPPPENIPAPDNEALREIAIAISRETSVDRRRRLMDMLDEACKFSAPKRMVDDEFGIIWRDLMRAYRVGKMDREDLGKSRRQLKAEYYYIADRRVRLGLVLGEIATRNNLIAKAFPWGRPADTSKIEDAVVQFIFSLATNIP